MEEKRQGGDIILTLDELQVLNQSNLSALEFNEKWISFGGLQALFAKLDTSPTEGIKAEDASRRRQLFGVNTYPSPAHGGKSWLTFGQLLWAACTDGKLLIIRVAFFLEIVLWLFGTGVQITRGETIQAEENEDADAGGNRVLNLMALTIISVLMVPVCLVLLVAWKNWKLQAAFRNVGEELRGDYKANVLRSGEVILVGKDEMVVGDIILLKSGDPIQADGLLFEAHDFSIGCNEEPMDVSLGSQSSSISFHFVEAGTSSNSGSAKFVVTAVGPNTRLGKAIASTPVAPLQSDKLIEEARSLSRKVIFTGLIIGGLTILIMIVRFSVSVYFIDKRSWYISHAQKLAIFVLSGAMIFDIVLQKSFPLVIVAAQFQGESMMAKSKLLVKSLDNVQTLGNISVLASFVGKLPEEIVQKFITAGIRVVTITTSENEDTADDYARYDSRSQMQLAAIQKLVNDGEIVAALGQGDVDQLALQRSHLGILLSATAVSECTIRSAHVIISEFDKTMVKQIELLLKFVNMGRSTYRNICRFIQLLIPAMIVIGLTKMGTSVIVSGNFRAVHTLWVFFLVFVLGLVFVCEPPNSDSYFMSCRPETAKWSLMSNIMRRNIVGQIVYQLIAMLVIYLLAGRLFFGSEPTRENFDMYIGTFIFHAITLMTLFNAYNCRLVLGEINIYANLRIPFCVVWGIAVLVQICILVLYPSQVALATRPLYTSEVAICFAFAVGTLLWQQVVNKIPVAGLPRKTSATEETFTMNLVSTPAGDRDEVQNV